MARKVKAEKSKKTPKEKDVRKKRKTREEKSEKSTKKSKTAKRDKEEKSTKKSKAEKVVKKSKKVKDEDKKSKKAKDKDKQRKKKRQREDDDEDEEIQVESKKSKKSKTDVAKAVFNPYANLDDTLDDIDKDLGLGGSSLNLDEERQHTGSLVLDMVVGKGLTAGWYTVFGPEQSCKSTGAMTMMTASLTSNVPILSYWDFEGCLTGSTKITVNGAETTFSKMLEGIKLQPGQCVLATGMGLNIKTACGEQRIGGFAYKGAQPTTIIETDGGKELSGFKHPVLAVTGDGLLKWTYMEELRVGDQVVTQ